jgi:hypothetical protein
MSCSALIRSNEQCFNLAQKLVNSLAEKYESVTFDDAWNHLCNNTVVQLQKKFKKQKKANNPLSVIKKPRTSFSFFTKTQRAKIAEQNPTATFGELSKLVSQAWRALTDKEMKTYKSMEIKDKKRYEVEKNKILDSIASQELTSTTVVNETTTSPIISTSKKSTTTSMETSPVVPKKVKSSSGKTTSTKASSDKKTSKTVGSYNAFQKVKRSELKEAHPTFVLKEINRKLGEMWKGLSTEQKAVYV